MFVGPLIPMPMSGFSRSITYPPNIPTSVTRKFYAPVVASSRAAKQSRVSYHQPAITFPLTVLLNEKDRGGILPPAAAT